MFKYIKSLFTPKFPGYYGPTTESNVFSTEEEITYRKVSRLNEALYNFYILYNKGFYHNDVYHGEAFEVWEGGYEHEGPRLFNSLRELEDFIAEQFAEKGTP